MVSLSCHVPTPVPNLKPLPLPFNIQYLIYIYRSAVKHHNYYSTGWKFEHKISHGLQCSSIWNQPNENVWHRRWNKKKKKKTLATEKNPDRDATPFFVKKTRNIYFCHQWPFPSPQNLWKTYIRPSVVTEVPLLLKKPGTYFWHGCPLPKILLKS